jgi:HEAT repeat protein
MDDALHNEILEFLIHRPFLQTQNGLRATILSAGLGDLLPYIDLSGAPHEAITNLINTFEDRVELPDGELALVRFLRQGVATQVGTNHQQYLQELCDRFRAWAVTNIPTRSVVSQWEGQQCELLDILGRPVAIGTHYQVLPLLREVKKERLPRKKGKHKKEDDKQEQQDTEERKEGEDSEEDDTPEQRYAEEEEEEQERHGRLAGVDILRWEEEELRAEHVTYEKLTLEQVFADFRSLIKEAQSDISRLVVLGPPGSGKTTLIQYLAWQAANEKLTVAKRSVIPVRVRLREWEMWAIKPHAPEFGLPEYLAEQYKDLTSAPLVRQWRTYLQRGDVLLLLDGLDEISNNQSFVDALKTALSNFKDCPTVLTCRTVSFEQHRALCPDFLVFTLSGLEAAQRGAYIQIFPAHNPEQYDAPKLIEQLNRTPQMQPLAANPLLLAIICYVVDDPQGVTLPARRSELYDKAVRKFLTYHQQHPRVTVAYPGTSPDEEDKRRILEHVAFRLFAGMDQQRHLTITQEQLKAAFKDAIVQIGYASDTAPLANALCQDLTANSGILCGDAEQGYFFLHLTFQEFLTAAYLARLVNNAEEGWETEITIRRKKVTVREVMDKKAWGPRWQEVLILFTGLLENPAPWLKLLMTKKKDDFFRHRLALATLCLPELAFDLREKHAKLISKITAISFSIWWRYHLKAVTDPVPHLSRILPALGQINSQIGSSPMRLRFARWINCVTGNPRQNASLLERLGGWLRDSPEIVQRLAIKAIGQIGSIAATPTILARLSKLLTDSNRYVQWAAVKAVGQIGRASAASSILPILADLLADSDRDIREATVTAIGQIGSAAATPEFLTHLAYRLADSDRNVQETLVAAVGAIGKAAAIPEFLSSLINLLADLDESVRGAAVEFIEILGNVAATPAILTRLADLLADSNPPVRETAVSAVSAIGSAALTPEILTRLSELLGDSDGQVRWAAITTIGEMGSVAATPTILTHLANRLGDSGLWIQITAEKTLQKIGKAAATPEFLAHLANLLVDADSYMREAAVIAVKSLGKAAATPEFLAHLTDLLVDQNYGVRRTAIEVVNAIGNAAAIPAILDNLADLLTDSNKNIRLDAVNAVGILGNAAVTPTILSHLTDLLFDSDQFVRGLGVASVRKLKNAASTPMILNRLIELLVDSNQFVREAAIKTVGQLGSSIVTPDILTRLADLLIDSDIAVRKAAVEAVGQLGTAIVTPVILTKLADRLVDSDCAVRKTAVEVVGQLGSPIVTPGILTYLVDRLADSDRSVQNAAIATVERLGDVITNPEFLTRLSGLLQDLEGDVRQSAVVAVGEIGNVVVTPEILTCLVYRLADSDFYVRWAAVEVVGKIGSAIATPAILSHLADRLADPNRQIREAAVEAVRQLGSAAATREFLTRLARLLVDSNSNIREVAVTAVGQMGSSSVTPTILGRLIDRLADSSKIVRQYAENTVGHLESEGIRIFKCWNGRCVGRTVAELSQLENDTD